jgi:UTP--glucose-1-phosphate uridylyltransferase
VSALAIDEETRKELSRFFFDEALLVRFAARAGESGTNYVDGVIEPTRPEDATLLPALKTAERERFAELGRAALSRGEVGVVVLAGGMATRFGGVVKAAVPVVDGRSFLDLKIADVHKLVDETGVTVPSYVMTSFATHDRITAQVKEEKLDGAHQVACFPQCVSLRLTPSGELFREADGSLSPYATGHGDLVFALRQSGVLSAFREKGGKLLYVSNVDNLGATLDAAVLGAHLASGAKVTAEVVRKEKGDRGGAPARVDGRPQIVEAFRFPPTFDQDTIPLFNTNSFVLDAEAIDRDFDLTYFRVEKKVEGRVAIQFERLVGQLTAFLPSHFLEVPRSGPDGRFQPVKDPPELEARRADIVEILRARGIVAR